MDRDSRGRFIRQGVPDRVERAARLDERHRAFMHLRSTPMDNRIIGVCIALIVAAVFYVLFVR